MWYKPWIQAYLQLYSYVPVNSPTASLGWVFCHLQLKEFRLQVKMQDYSLTVTI